MAICIEIGSFVFEVQRSQVGNRRTNGRTDRRTDRRTDEGTRREHYASGQCTDKTIYSLTALHSCVFMTLSAFCPRQLSFLFTSLGKGRVGVKWDKCEVEEESGEGRKGVQRDETKTSPKTHVFGILGRPFGQPPHVMHFQKALIHEQNLLTGHLLKMTILKNIVTIMQRIWNYGGRPWELGYRRMPYIFRNLFSRVTYPPVLSRLQILLASKLTILKYIF